MGDIMINKLIGVALLSFVILGVTIVVTSKQNPSKKGTTADIDSIKKAILALTKKVDKQQQVTQSKTTQPKVVQSQITQSKTIQPQQQVTQQQVTQPEDLTPPTPAFSYMLKSNSFDKEGN